MRLPRCARNDEVIVINQSFLTVKIADSRWSSHYKRGLSCHRNHPALYSISTSILILRGPLMTATGKSMPAEKCAGIFHPAAPIRPDINPGALTQASRTTRSRVALPRDEHCGQPERKPVFVTDYSACRSASQYNASRLYSSGERINANFSL
jgi:hypothetical protein